MDDKEDIQIALFGGGDLQQLHRSTQKLKNTHYNTSCEVWQCVIPTNDWRSEQ